jgi:hypothetical protein
VEPAASVQMCLGNKHLTNQLVIYNVNFIHVKYIIFNKKKFIFNINLYLINEFIV